jgi:hypothetical protein
MSEMNTVLKSELALRGNALQQFIQSGAARFQRIHSREGEALEYLFGWEVRNVPSSFNSFYDYVMAPASGFTVNPAGGVSLRNQRECATIATAIDLALTGNSNDGLEVLMRRLIALRQSMTLQVVPPTSTPGTGQGGGGGGPPRGGGGAKAKAPTEAVIWERASEVESRATWRGSEGSGVPQELQAAYAARRKAARGDNLV